MVHPEGIINAALSRAKSDAILAFVDAMAMSCDEINEQVAVPLAHAPRMVGGFFSDKSTKHQKQLPVLEVVSRVMEWVSAKCTDWLFTLASEAVGFNVSN